MLLGFRLICWIVSAMLASISVNRLGLRVHGMHLFDGGILLTRVCRQGAFAGLKTQDIELKYQSRSRVDINEYDQIFHFTD